MLDLKGDWDYIQQIATQRLANNKTARHEYRSGPIIETIGAAGELAALRFFGLTEKLHTGFDGGIDIVTRYGTIDIKATQLFWDMHNRHLQLPWFKEPKADYIVLVGVSVENRIANMLGWCTPEELLSQPVNLDRRVPCYETPISKLHRMKELNVPQKSPHPGQCDYA